MQRLFSMFPRGWPGTALLLLRMVSGSLLIRQGLSSPGALVMQPLEAVAGALLILGLWTPVAGAVAVVFESWAAITMAEDPSRAVLLAAIGAALAMLGPGSTSLDNKLFGRKRISLQQHP